MPTKIDKSIVKSLSSYDGKRVAPFLLIANELSIRPDSLEIAVSIIESTEPNAKVGGTWILKHLLELGIDARNDLCNKVTLWLESIYEKDVRLHLLQILNLIEIPPSLHDELYATGVEMTTDKNTFIRAWAYNLIGLIANNNSRFESDARIRFRNALKHESASIRARIRNSVFASAKRV